MHRICDHCGAIVSEEDIFCLNCGNDVSSLVLSSDAPSESPAQVETPTEAPAKTPARKKRPVKKIRLRAICIGLAVVVILTVAVIFFYKNKSHPYTTALDKAFTYDYFSSMETLEALAPEAYWEKESFFHHVIIGTVVDIINPKKDFYEEFLGKDLAFSYDFKDVTPYSYGQVAMFGEALERKYGIDAKTVTEARHLVFDMTAKGENGMEKKHNLAEDVIKIDGQWYCFSYYYTNGALGIMFHRQ